MAKIDKLTEQRIKDAADIVQVVGDFVDLKKSGANYMGLCPFHDDRNIGSFVVSPAKNVCSCFSCGVHYNAVDFLMNVGNGMTYPESLRWLGAKFGVYIDDDSPVIQKAEPRKPAPQLPVATLPMEFVKGKLGHSGNVLIDYLKNLEWCQDDRVMLDYWLTMYMVGTSNNGDTKGWTIWWYIDEDKQVRTGKLMRYLSDGHRDKMNKYNTNWIHSMLEKAGIINLSNYRVEPCLFGLHLVDAFPDAEICIVESEKSAIIAQTASIPGEKLFMATGSKGGLSRQKLQPLIDRNRWIILYPDIDGFDEWERAAKAMDYPKIQVSNRVKKLWKEEDGKKADIADIIIRNITQAKAPPETVSQRAHRLLHLEQENENLTKLIDAFQLEII